ncbi:MAG: LacI family transcriptional regulator [Clostridiales bacterium]|nr:LacI family transcriptional regulator [Clostridiales bacterium]
METHNKISIRTVGEKAGVSQSTVSMVLNGRGDEMRISAQTQQRVLEAAEALGYTAERAARKERLETARPLNLVVFWNDKLLGEEMAHFMKGALSYIEEHQCHVVLSMRMFREGCLLEDPIFRNLNHVDGIIADGLGNKDMEELEPLREQIPIVLSSRFSPNISAVYTDGYSIGRDVARLFAEAGLKRAGIVSSVRPSIGSSLRTVGFRDGCRAFGIECRDEWILQTDEFDFEQIVIDTEKMFEQEEIPDCLLIQQVSMAPGVASGLRRKGIGVPSDVALLAYGLNHFMSDIFSTISMIGGPLEAFGEVSVDLLMMLIQNKIGSPVSRIIPPEYHFSQSFRPLQNIEQMLK